MSKIDVLVTGGAGFIGSHLTNKLIDLGYSVTILDNLSTGSEKNINKQANFLNLDLSSKSTYEKLSKEFEIIFHLAAQVSNEVSYENPKHDLEANCLSSLLLLNWAKQSSIKKLIFSSTMGVYKDNLNFAVNESSPLEPKGFYGINKRSIEDYLRVFSDEGMQINILRLFNVYGPGQNMNDLRQGMLSIYMSYIWKKKTLEIKGPLERVRDFVHVDDVVNAFILTGLGNNFGNLYNVCSGRKTSVLDAIKIIKESFGVTEDYPTEILDRTSRDIDSIYGDYGKINKDFGWEPTIELESGIKAMVSWLKNGDLNE